MQSDGVFLSAGGRDLDALRARPLIVVLSQLEVHGIRYRVDPTFVPEKNRTTVRVTVSNDGGMVWEVLITGEKWFDTRTGRGSGGSVDLVMLLLRVPFKRAVSVLRALPVVG